MSTRPRINLPGSIHPPINSLGSTHPIPICMGDVTCIDIDKYLATKSVQYTVECKVQSIDCVIIYRTKVKTLHLNCLPSVYKIMQTKSANESVP